MSVSNEKYPYLVICVVDSQIKIVCNELPKPIEPSDNELKSWKNNSIIVDFKTDEDAWKTRTYALKKYFSNKSAGEREIPTLLSNGIAIDCVEIRKYKMIDCIRLKEPKLLAVFTGNESYIKGAYWDIAKSIEEKSVYILCAANHYEDYIHHIHQPTNIKTGFVICGQRHHNCIYTFSLTQKDVNREDTVALMRKETQGFLTNTNEFVDRVRAREIALKAGQLEGRKTHSKTQLFSEDLY